MQAKYQKIYQDIKSLASKLEKNYDIPSELFTKFQVNRGLRDVNGNGVLTGLTEISEIVAFKTNDEGFKVPCEGELYYRGYNINDLANDYLTNERFGFEEITYLLLFGKLPSQKSLTSFNEILYRYRTLPTNFVRDIIMKAPSSDMMNTLARSVLTLFSYDDYASITSLPNVLRQCLLLISVFPMLSVYGYQAYFNYLNGGDFFIHEPKKEYSTAENILYMLRKDGKFTKTEAKILDIALVLHAEHGGGNNSTFTTRVVTSSGTDTYSTIAAALGSLKGPKHGGANVKVAKMFEDIKSNIKDWNDDDEIFSYLSKILNKEAFDEQGLIYGMGHAVYSLSDPRADIFKSLVKKLAEEKNRESEYNLYNKIERLSSEAIKAKRNIYKGVAANVDFYTGFVYSMLDIPYPLFTPIFAIARISGWSAHRLEELLGGGKIIRPAYMSVCNKKQYKPLNER